MKISQENTSDLEMRINKLYEQQLELCCRYARRKEENYLEMPDNMRAHLVNVYELLRKDEIVRAKAYIRCLIREADLRRMEKIYGGSIIVDSLIDDASDRARKANIDFGANVKLPDGLPVRACDLTVVLRNLLDYALGDCDNGDAENRRIDVDVECERDILAVRVRYCCKSGEKKPEGTANGEEFVSAEPEPDLTAIEQTVKQYRGRVSVEREESSCQIIAVMFGDSKAID